jgi:hypothetical protein
VLHLALSMWMFSQPDMFPEVGDKTAGLARDRTAQSPSLRLRTGRKLPLMTGDVMRRHWGWFVLITRLSPLDPLASQGSFAKDYFRGFSAGNGTAAAHLTVGSQTHLSVGERITSLNNALAFPLWLIFLIGACLDISYKFYIKRLVRTGAQAPPMTSPLGRTRSGRRSCSFPTGGSHYPVPSTTSSCGLPLPVKPNVSSWCQVAGIWSWLPSLQEKHQWEGNPNYFKAIPKDTLIFRIRNQILKKDVLER